MTTKLPRPDLAVLAVCALCVVGIVVLAALRVAIPDVLYYVATGALSAGAGISLNTPNAPETITVPTARPVTSSSASIPPARVPNPPTPLTPVAMPAPAPAAAP